MSSIHNHPFAGEASPPTEATLHETLRYLFDECMRRAHASTSGLTNDMLNATPGQGAMSLGAILEHQLKLIRMLTEFIEPGSTDSIGKISMGKPDDWNLADFERQREALCKAFYRALKQANPETFMEKRREMQPRRWEEWPVLMRVLRPLADFATHVGQVNYARRQLGNPVGKPQ